MVLKTLDKWGWQRAALVSSPQGRLSVITGKERLGAGGGAGRYIHSPNFAALAAAAAAWEPTPGAGEGERC